MAMLFDYMCERCCGRFEAWGSTGDKQPCPTCNAQAFQLPAAPGISLSFKDEGFPRASRRWAEQHERAAMLPPKD